MDKIELLAKIERNDEGYAFKTDEDAALVFFSRTLPNYYTALATMYAPGYVIATRVQKGVTADGYATNSCEPIVTYAVYSEKEWAKAGLNAAPLLQMDAEFEDPLLYDRQWVKTIKEDMADCMEEFL